MIVYSWFVIMTAIEINISKCERVSKTLLPTYFYVHHSNGWAVFLLTPIEVAITDFGFSILLLTGFRFIELLNVYRPAR